MPHVVVIDREEIARAIASYTGCQEPIVEEETYRDEWYTPLCVKHLNSWPCVAGIAADSVISRLRA